MILLGSLLLLGGCFPQPHSWQSSAKPCLHATGSFMCQNTAEAKDSLSAADDPSLNNHTVTPHD
jgi:hypothetical protein